VSQCDVPRDRRLAVRLHPGPQPAGEGSDRGHLQLPRARRRCFKTALAAYDGASGPDGRCGPPACIKATTYGTSSLTGDSKFASLDGTSKSVTIAAGATVSVYVAAYYAYDPREACRLDRQGEAERLDDLAPVTSARARAAFTVGRARCRRR